MKNAFMLFPFRNYSAQAIGTLPRAAGFPWIGVGIEMLPCSAPATGAGGRRMFYCVVERLERSGGLVGEAEVFAQLVFDVETLFGEKCAERRRTSQVCRVPQRVRKLAIGGHEVGVRRQCGSVD